MKLAFTNLKPFTLTTFFIISFGLTGCDKYQQKNPINTQIPKININKFIGKKIVNGNISLSNKLIKKKLTITPCNTQHNKVCAPPKGSKIIGEQTATITIKSYETKVNSVLCTVTFEGPGYSFQVQWHEPGDTCSMGEPV